MSKEMKHEIGGGRIRCMTLPDNGAERKEYPIASGFFDYFPDAIAAIARLSFVANEQHNPGQPVHWARGKSSDHADTMLRHFSQRGTTDNDGQRHSVKMAWRALALLQEEIEAETVTPSSAADPALVYVEQPWLREAHKQPTLPTRQARPSGDR